MDESDADDGAIFRFWAFIAERRRHRDRPQFDPAVIEQLLEAVDAFDAGDQP